MDLQSSWEFIARLYPLLRWVLKVFGPGKSTYIVKVKVYLMYSTHLDAVCNHFKTTLSPDFTETQPTLK